MTHARSSEPPKGPESPPDQEDQLSPTRALRKSTGASGSQRIGNNGPVANPDVSFPDEDGAQTNQPPS
jgi:hypothetical protein